MWRVVCVLIALSMGLGCRTPTLEFRYDEFSGAHTLSSAKVRLGNVTPTLRFYTYAVTVDGTVPTISVFLLSSTDEWRFLKCHDLMWLVDERRLPLMPTKHDGTVYRGGVAETIRQDMPVEVFRTLVNAQQVRGRLCDTKFRLNGPHLEHLSAFARAATLGPPAM